MLKLGFASNFLQKAYLETTKLTPWSYIHVLRQTFENVVSPTLNKVSLWQNKL